MVAAPKLTDGADWSMFASVPEEAVVRNPSLLLCLPAANTALESKKGSEEQNINYADIVAPTHATARYFKTSFEMALPRPPRLTRSSRGPVAREARDPPPAACRTPSQSPQERNHSQ